MSIRCMRSDFQGAACLVGCFIELSLLRNKPAKAARGLTKSGCKRIAARNSLAAANGSPWLQNNIPRFLCTSALSGRIARAA